MPKKISKAATAALKIYPEQVWMEQISNINPYYKEREGFKTCWAKMIEDVGVHYKEADRNYRNALKEAKKSGLTNTDNITHYNGQREAYLTILRGLMHETEVIAFIRKK